MSDDATVVRKPPPHRSGRIAAILIWILSAVMAVTGFFFGYSHFITGDSNADISEFEASLKDYMRAATQAGYPRIPGVSFILNIKIPELVGLDEQSARLEQAVRSLRHYKNENRAEAMINQAVAEYNFAQSSNQEDLQVHSKSELLAIKRGWQHKNTAEAIFRGLWIGAVWGIVTLVVTSILFIVLALVWFFMMDRLRDISRAIRGD